MSGSLPSYVGIVLIDVLRDLPPVDAEPLRWDLGLATLPIQWSRASW